MHLYIWLLGQTDHAVSDYCIQMAENKQKHSSSPHTIHIQSEQSLSLISLFSVPVKMSPGQETKQDDLT